MARTFIVNKQAQSTGEHEVHDLGSCRNLPQFENQVTLGNFENCHQAVIFAKQKYTQDQIDGCAFCCPACHTR